MSVETWNVRKLPERIAPEPLRKTTAAPAEYPVDALGPILGHAAMALHRTVQSPMALCAQSVLAAASLATQPHADVVIDGRRMPLSLWFVTIAESGERKSATDGPALAEHRAIERERVERYRNELAEHDIEAKARKAEAQAAERDKDTAKLRGRLATTAMPEAPMLPHLIASDPTVEGMHKLMMAGRGSVGLFSDEGGQFLGGHAMNRDNSMRSAAALSTLWDRGEADRIRGGDGAVKLYGKRLALHLLAQPVIAERVLSDPVLSGQGFLARCLLAWPASRAGFRPYVEADLSTDPAMREYRHRMRELLELPPHVREGTRNELDPPALHLTTDAKRLWMQAHDAIERCQQPGGDYERIRPWASKAAENIARIAAVLTMVANPDAREIGQPAIDAAATLVDFYLAEAVRLADTAVVPPDIRNAEAIVDWCRSRTLNRVHSVALMQSGPNAVRDADALAAAMRRLEDAGWAEPLPAGTVIDGKPRRKSWAIRLDSTEG